MKLVHLSRRLVLAGAVGFVFAPATGADHGVSSIRLVGQKAADSASRTTSSSKLLKDTFLAAVPLKSLPSSRRAELGRTAIIGTVHCILAACMLSALPSLDFIAVSWELYHFPASPLFSRLLAYDSCAVAYASLVALRLLHVLTIQVCMSVFVFHFLFGFFCPGDHSHKGFWAEYTACRLFAQLMLLASVNSWFSWPALFDQLPVYLQRAALGVAAFHFIFCFRFCLRNLFLVVRNVEYSESELAGIFMDARWKEDVFETLVDLQLAFVEGVQDQLLESKKQGDSFSYFSNLAKQLWLLTKFYLNSKLAAKEEEKTERDLKGLTVKQLRNLCGEKGVEHKHLKTKAEILAVLE